MKFNLEEIVLNWCNLSGIQNTEISFDESVSHSKKYYKALKRDGNIYDELQEIKTLDEFYKKVHEISHPLKESAKSTVIYRGVPNPDVLVIGEAPGENEDESGVPFCGDSGILLSNALKAIGLSDDKNLYITNVCFFRPPLNRAPTKEEINFFKPYLEKHVELVNPKFIITTGASAFAAISNQKALDKSDFLYTNSFLSKEIPGNMIYHPAFLLRQPSKKKEMWFTLINIASNLKIIQE